MANGQHVSAFQRAQATNEVLREQVGLLRQVREQTAGIVGLQERGVQQARELAQVAPVVATIGRSEGGGGGGGFQDFGTAAVIGLLVRALSSGGGGSGGSGPGFQTRAPSLRGATFARSLALGQFR